MSVAPVPAAVPAPPVPSAGRWFLRVLAAFARREARMVAGYRLSFLARGASFGLSVLALAFLGRLVGAGANPHLAAYGGDYLAFALVGLVVLDLQQVAVTTLAHRVRTAQLLGVMEAEMAAPAPAWIVLGVVPAYELGLAAVRAALYFALAALAFGVAFPGVSYTSLALAVPLTLSAFAGLGLLSAATTMLARRTNPVAVLLASASLLLSGVAYPVSVLPAWLRAAGRALPLTHALEAFRGALLVGAPPASLRGPLTALLAIAAALVPAGLGLFLYALRRARTDGSLTHY